MPTLHCPLCVAGGFESKAELRTHVALSHSDSNMERRPAPPDANELTTYQLRALFDAAVARTGHQVVAVSTGHTVRVPTHLCGQCHRDTDGLWRVWYISGETGLESLCDKCGFTLPTTRKYMGAELVRTTAKLIAVSRVGGTLGFGDAKWRLS